MEAAPHEELEGEQFEGENFQSCLFERVLVCTSIINLNIAGEEGSDEAAVEQQVVRFVVEAPFTYIAALPNAFACLEIMGKGDSDSHIFQFTSQHECDAWLSDLQHKTLQVEDISDQRTACSDLDEFMS